MRAVPNSSAGVHYQILGNARERWKGLLLSLLGHPRTPCLSCLTIQPPHTDQDGEATLSRVPRSIFWQQRVWRSRSSGTKTLLREASFLKILGSPPRADRYYVSHGPCRGLEPLVKPHIRHDREQYCAGGAHWTMSLNNYLFQYKMDMYIHLPGIFIFGEDRDGMMNCFGNRA